MKRKLPDNTPKKAIKIRLYPNKDQAILLAKAFGCCRKIYNSLLELQQKKLPCPTEVQFKALYPYMTEVDSIALQQSRINLQQANNSYFKSLKGQRKGPKIQIPKFKSKRLCKTYSFTGPCMWGDVVHRRRLLNWEATALVAVVVHQ